MSVVAKILANAEAQPANSAIFNKQTEVTYSELAADIREAAAWLHQQGVGAGDRIIITATNSYEFIRTYFGAHLAGATAVVLPGDAPEATKSFVIERAEPRLVVTGGSEPEVSSPVEGFEVVLRDDMAADLMFTSGATGEPKGVLLTHAQQVAATEHIIANIGNTGADVELLLMPLGHSFGMARMRTTLYAGGILIVGYPLQRLKGVFKAMTDFGVTGLGLVPAAWAFITQMSKDKLAGYADQLNYIELGSAYLDQSEKQRLAAWFPDTRILMHYGLTEVSRAIFADIHSDDRDSVGRIGTGADVCILTPDGDEAPLGDEGEIALKAPWMLAEYYRNPELTEASFSDGFFRTGDLGRLDGDLLFLTGRLKEIINVGGKKVSPLDVEKVLNSSEIVSESACTAMADKDSGEAVQAHIVLHDGDMVQERAVEALEARVAQSLAVHMRPRKYRFVDSLPKTDAGKIQRHKLKS